MMVAERPADPLRKIAFVFVFVFVHVFIDAGNDAPSRKEMSHV